MKGEVAEWLRVLLQFGRKGKALEGVEEAGKVSTLMVVVVALVQYYRNPSDRREHHRLQMQRSRKGLEKSRDHLWDNQDTWRLFNE